MAGFLYLTGGGDADLDWALDPERWKEGDW